MTASQATPEQIAAAHALLRDDMRAAEARIKSGKLKDPLQNGANGWLIGDYVREHNLVPNADTFYLAIVALADKLEWVTKPTALQEKNKPEKVTKQVDFELERQAAARKQEADAATKKDSDKGYAAAKSAVDGYLPYRRGPGGADVVDYLEMETTKELLKKHIASEESKGVHGQAVLEKIAEFLQKQYESQEKKKERS